MVRKVKQSFLIVHIFWCLLIINPLMAQDYQSIPAPAGFGNQVLHELLMKEDTLIMALTGDGSYDWDGVHFSFPVNSTLIFETTLEEKYPIKSASLSSTAGKVE